MNLLTVMYGVFEMCGYGWEWDWRSLSLIATQLFTYLLTACKLIMHAAKYYLKCTWPT